MTHIYDTTISGDNETSVRSLVRDHVVGNVSNLMSQIRNYTSSNFDWWKDVEGAFSVATDAAKVAADHGWRQATNTNGEKLFDANGNPQFINDVDDDIHSYESWADLCDDMGFHIHGREVFEHWAVTSWLAGKLTDQDEKIVWLDGLPIWCRTTTGGALHLDNVMILIAEASKN